LVEREFDVYLACGRLEHGFLRVRCEQCHAEQLGLTHKTVCTGAATQVQRFGRALNLNMSRGAPS
jgi:hypothetical protein